MRITVFTAVDAASASARASSLTVASLRESGHDVVVVGTHEHWPDERAGGFDDAIPWRERHRIEPRVAQSDLVLHEVTAEEGETLGSLTWIPFTHGLVSIDDLGRHGEATRRILREADALVLHEATDADLLAREFDLPVHELPLPARAAGDPPAPRSPVGSPPDLPTVGATGSPSPEDAVEAVIIAIAADRVVRRSFAVSLTARDPSTPALRLLASDLGVSVSPTDRPDVAVTFFSPAMPWAESFEHLAATALGGSVAVAVGGPRSSLVSGSAAVRLGPDEPVTAVLAGLRTLLREPREGDAHAVEEALAPSRIAQELVDLATLGAVGRPARQVDVAFAALRTGSPALAAQFAADTALLRGGPARSNGDSAAR